MTLNTQSGTSCCRMGVRQVGMHAPQPHCAVQEFPVCGGTDFSGWNEVTCHVYLTWNGQMKVPDSGLWRAHTFMKIHSLSLERLLNLKGVASYFMLPDSNGLEALCEDSFLKMLALHFEWLKPYNKTLGPPSSLPQLQHLCRRHNNCFHKMG